MTPLFLSVILTLLPLTTPPPNHLPPPFQSLTYPPLIETPEWLTCDIVRRLAYARAFNNLRTCLDNPTNDPMVCLHDCERALHDADDAYAACLLWAIATYFGTLD